MYDYTAFRSFLQITSRFPREAFLQVSLACPHGNRPSYPYAVRASFAPGVFAYCQGGKLAWPSMLLGTYPRGHASNLQSDSVIARMTW